MSFARRELLIGIGTLGLASGAAQPALALDVLEGLSPMDFRGDGLVQAEARALAPTTPLLGGRGPVAANPLGRSGGATTLSDLGVGSGAAELRVSGAGEERLLVAASPEERRLLSTLAVLGDLDGVVGGGGAVDLGDLLDDLEDPADDLLDDLLGNGGVVPGLLGGDESLLDLPVEDLQEILDELPIQLPLRLPTLLP